MRLRRAATCVRVARQAMAEGRIQDAEDRLEEACELDPDQAEARQLLDDLQELGTAAIGTAAGSGEHFRGSGWSHWVAAGAAILMLAALAFFWSPDDRPRRVTPARRGPSLPAVDLPAAVQLQPSPGGALPLEALAVAPDNRMHERPVATSGRSSSPPPGEASRAQGEAIGPPRPQPQAFTAPAPDATPASLPAAVALAAAGLEPPSSSPPPAGIATGVHLAESQPRPALDSVARPGDAALRADATVRFPATNEPTPPPQPDPAPASLRSVTAPADEDLIRATLGRYADAYARLDAAAAQAVWPSVDTQALRRAFDGLASQGLVFEHCELRIEGVAATAACRGRASFVPKVGRREPLNVSRLWVFSLRKGEAGWAIQAADAR